MATLQGTHISSDKAMGKLWVNFSFINKINKFNEFFDELLWIAFHNNVDYINKKYNQDTCFNDTDVVVMGREINENWIVKQSIG